MLLEEIYAKYPYASLPSELSGQPIISSKSTRQSTSTFGVPDPRTHMPSFFAGWFPNSAPGPSNMPPYPLWPMPGPSHAPFYPSYPPVPSNIPSSNEVAPRSLSNEGSDLEYPSIADFFEDLMNSEDNHHYFTNFMDVFHEQGYYRVDHLADESLMVEHMTRIIEQLKDGTAWVIK